MSPSRRILSSLLLLGSGCGEAIDRARVLVGGADAPAPEVVLEPASDDVRTDPPSERPPAIPPTVSTGVPAASTPEELEVADVELEWVARPTWGYAGSVATYETLRVHGTGRVRKSVGPRAKVAVKAVCEAEPAPIADADVSPIDGSFVETIPPPPEDFRLGAELFLTVQPGKPSRCRVQFQLIDEDAKPIRRGTVELCWHRGSRAAVACTDEDAMPSDARPRDTWSIARAEFAPSGELLFSVVAGRALPPDRVAVRTTCYVGDKRFVDFDWLVGRWYALAPGEEIRQRMMMTDLADLMRFAECDLAFQDIDYDHEALAMRGAQDLAHLCVRPTGLQQGACRVEESQQAAWDPASAPAKVALTHSGGHAWRGSFNAYMNGELTMLAAIPKGARLEAVARCGTRESTQAIATSFGLELLWPGQSVRIWGGASLASRGSKDCRLDVVLKTTDRAGKPTSFSLAQTCFDRAGTSRPCTT